MRTQQTPSMTGHRSAHIISSGQPELIEIEEAITKEIIEYSHHRLNTSSFFGALKRGEIDLPRLRYVFCQYRHWRDQFHTWFGLCILKSGTCAPSYVRDTVLELADHTLTEMREDHAGLYRDFLQRLGVTSEELENQGKSDCTIGYERSFLQRFGTAIDNFVESVAALSARELFAALRNTFVMKALKEKYNIEQSPWWQLHESLEVEHFKGSMRPSIPEILKNRTLDDAVSIMRSEIDHHARYWDCLLAEAAAAVQSSNH